ncbi:hypothetical protein RHSIM_Rhsim01G0171900 [Rhododendron simsii]|uniref:Reverse transcriptase domain-containing protein n=1 Tax=Rhododendron simsii TaxID=118357 RepID=A0A834LV19_RHOSS|nr:hypothetical protein RHSIM_Rhsim01G0171900 [Rhododendron simsii]
MEEPLIISLDNSFEECPQTAKFVLVSKILASKTLNKGPWSVMGSLLILRRWDMKKAFSDLDFNFSPFWVQGKRVTDKVSTESKDDDTSHKGTSLGSGSLPVEGGPSSIIGGPQYYVEELYSPRMENRPNITLFEGSSLTMGLEVELSPWSNQREDGLSSVFAKALNLKRKKGDSSEEEELSKKPIRIGWKNEGVSDNERVVPQLNKKEYVHKGRGIRGRGRQGVRDRARGSMEMVWERKILSSDAGLVDVELEAVVDGFNFQSKGSEPANSVNVDGGERAVVAGLKQPQTNGDAYYVDPEGISGGLALLWSDEFESKWTTHPECKELITKEWEVHQRGSDMFSLVQKLKRCREALVKWMVDNVNLEQMNLSPIRDVSEDEIKRATFELGSQKSPGLDGYPELNNTNITLIPKVFCMEALGQFRPISLCNFAMKVITKVMANRLKGILQEVISPNKLAFVPGCLIQDNIIVAHEAFHFLKMKKGTGGFMALTLNFNKAYDRVKWDFVKALMNKMEFHASWINWVMQYDALLFLKAEIQNCQVIKDILCTYGEASGQRINFDKSGIAFSSNLNDVEKQLVWDLHGDLHKWRGDGGPCQRCARLRRGGAEDTLLSGEAKEGGGEA